MFTRKTYPWLFNCWWFCSHRFPAKRYDEGFGSESHDVTCVSWAPSMNIFENSGSVQFFARFEISLICPIKVVKIHAIHFRTSRKSFWSRWIPVEFDLPLKWIKMVFFNTVKMDQDGLVIWFKIRTFEVDQNDFLRMRQLLIAYSKYKSGSE